MPAIRTSLAATTSPLKALPWQALDAVLRGISFDFELNGLPVVHADVGGKTLVFESADSVDTPLRVGIAGLTIFFDDGVFSAIWHTPYPRMGEINP
jgi:hypothetical protein